MTTLQILAAETAGVERLVFHTGGPGGEEDLKAAIDLVNGRLATSRAIETRRLIGQIAGLGLTWGVSDGN